MRTIAVLPFLAAALPFTLVCCSSVTTENVLKEPVATDFTSTMSPEQMRACIMSGEWQDELTAYPTPAGYTLSRIMGQGGFAPRAMWAVEITAAATGSHVVGHVPEPIIKLADHWNDELHEAVDHCVPPARSATSAPATATR